jgi:hypothetical protein
MKFRHSVIALVSILLLSACGARDEPALGQAAANPADLLLPVL